ncbi:hypothetical protein [Streptomyces sp. Ag109_O5-1]|uniref:hypothetical protein n=1 Tax=Streptomyces sp. Ag109_O5-1 TaxID=1938851 RepID=UPI000F4F363E|nr:hypothetical protein [Streptomyces sp. Ag109_O5-1]
MFERSVLPGGHHDLFADPVHVVGHDVAEVHRGRFTVAQAAAAHQVDDQHERVVAGGTYPAQLLRGGDDGARGVVLRRLDPGHGVLRVDAETLSIEGDRAQFVEGVGLGGQTDPLRSMVRINPSTTLWSTEFIRRLPSAG